MSGDWCAKHEVNHAGEAVCWKCALEWRDVLVKIADGPNTQELLAAGFMHGDDAIANIWRSFGINAWTDARIVLGRENHLPLPPPSCG